jgi:hypothetical protein
MSSRVWECVVEHGSFEDSAIYDSQVRPSNIYLYTVESLTNPTGVGKL